ncbi:MAG: CPBP family intramembrane metalloprotease [Chloroflexi bacterium]|nr:CPBP family intramembrane metalloprotease [Chloroflexota bacterium]
MSRLVSLGGWLILIGIALGVPSGIIAFLLYRSTPIGQQPDTLVAIGLALAIVLSVLAALILVAGLVIYVVVPGSSRERAQQDYGSHRTVFACLALAIVASLVFQGAYALLYSAVTGNALTVQVTSPTGSVSAIPSPVVILVSVVTVEIALLLVLWLRIIRPGVITWRDMGITSQRLGRRILAGIGGGFAVFVIVVVIELVLRQLGIEQTQMQQFASIKQASTLQFILLLLAGGALAGFVEESFFRGYVFRAYLAKKGVWQAYLFSSLVFALAHLYSPPSVVPIFAIGLTFAHIYRLNNSVVPTMIAHAMNNSVAFTALYFGQV